jgi:hypothetical protein
MEDSTLTPCSHHAPYAKLYTRSCTAIILGVPTSTLAYLLPTMFFYPFID